MAVVLQQQGTVVGAVTTGNLTVNFPAYAADDIVVITTVGYVPNTTTGTNTQTLASPWTKYTPNVTTITGGIIDNEFAFWWARATSVSSLGTSVTITRPTSWDTGNDTVWAGRAYVIRGCVTTGNPFDQLVASAISTASNPPLPAVNVSGAARLVISFYVASDNLQAPTAASGYTVNTSLTTATGTDAGFQSYQDLTDVSVSAVTPSGGATSAQNFQVYFSASFAPEPATLSRTATGFGTGTESADGFKTLDRTATGSGLGDGSGDDQLDHQRTADGSGAGTQSAAGSILAIIDRTATGVGSSDQFASGVIPVTYNRTASGAGSGTQTAVGVKVKVRTVKEFGQSTLSAVIRSTSNNSNLYTGDVISFAQSFVGDGKTLDLMGFHATGGAGKTGTVVAKLYLASGGKPTGSVLATSDPLNAVDLPIFSTTANYVRFSFTGANKYLLSNGVEYCAAIEHTAATTFSTGVRVFFATPNDGSFAKIGVGTFSQTSNGSTWTTTANYALLHFVETSSAAGVTTKSRTATGSGTGTESATGAAVLVIQRTATGSGIGTMDSTGITERFRTAFGLGSGESTADTLHNNIRSASGAGGASPGASATGLVTRLRDASGAGAGTSNSFGLHVHIETATGFGSSDQTATVSVYQVKLGGLTDFSFPYRFGGRFYVGVFVVNRTATGFGTGTQSSTGEFIRDRAAAGSGLGTSFTESVTTRFRTGADSAGTGSSAASRVVTSSRSATASGLGVSSSTALLTVIRTSTGFGNGSSLGYASTIRFRTAVGNGLGSDYVLGGILYARTSAGSGVGDSSAIWYKTLIFRPPFDGEFRWAEYGATDSTSMFFGRMRPGQRASNIYKMVDGTYTTIPSRDYSIVSKVYHGGHENLVTPEEKADLIAAGYGDYVT